MTPNVISLIQAGHLPYDILLELPYRNKRIGNVLPPLAVDSWPIENLAISSRSKNCLLRHSVVFLSDICNFTFRELADIRFFGPGSFDEVVSEYISKIGLDGTDDKNMLVQVTPQKNQKSPSDIDLALDYIIKNVGKREASIIRNSLSSNRMKISDLSEAWGISRQRSYQIVDKLQEDISNLSCFDSLAKSCMGTWEIATVGELLQIHPHLCLGRAENDFSVSILDLLFYSGLLSRIENYLIAIPGLNTLNLHELFVYSYENRNREPKIISPQVAKLSTEFVNKQEFIKLSRTYSGDVMLEAEEWANKPEI